MLMLNVVALTSRTFTSIRFPARVVSMLKLDFVLFDSLTTVICIGLVFTNQKKVTLIFFRIFEFYEVIEFWLNSKNTEKQRQLLTQQREGKGVVTQLPRESRKEHV